jgi:hypothetical protein
MLHGVVAANRPAAVGEPDDATTPCGFVELS